MVEVLFVLSLLGILGVALLPPIHMWWTDDIWKESPKQKWHARRKAMKNNRLNRKENGLPMYERVARSYERQAEEALHSKNPSEALRWEHEARKVREDGLKNMMEGKII